MDGHKAAIYVRVSTAGQEKDGTSFASQEQGCRAVAQSKGYEIVDVYSNVHTGAEYRERPALLRLRELVRAGGVDVVLAYALDRLSRNQAHLYILAEEIESSGARLEFVTEDFEDSAVGRFIRSAKAFAAEVEREKIAERSHRGKRARVESGRPLPAGSPAVRLSVGRRHPQPAAGRSDNWSDCEADLRGLPFRSVAPHDCTAVD